MVVRDASPIDVPKEVPLTVGELVELRATLERLTRHQWGAGHFAQLAVLALRAASLSELATAARVIAQAAPIRGPWLAELIARACRERGTAE